MKNRIPRAVAIDMRNEPLDVKTERERKVDARKVMEAERKQIRNRKPIPFMNSQRFRKKVKIDDRSDETKAEARSKGINPRKFKAISVKKQRTFKVKDRKQLMTYTVVNTVFANIKTELIPANAMKQDYYVSGTSMWRACGRRVRFRKNILYPSVKEKGIVDPLLLQYFTNVPEAFSGFRCILGNNRLTLLKEYPDLDIQELPCFVINIKGEGGGFSEPIIEGELIDSEDKALQHYKYTGVYQKHGRKGLTFSFNEDSWLIDVFIRKFLGEY